MRASPGIEKFLAQVSRCTDKDKVLETIKHLKATTDYKCPPVSVFALHLILDLYSEDSSLQANINRMTVSLEAAAHDLLRLSQLIKERA
jgi:hypothetical protein